ncbi:prepilin-type N-terminal cleavage/methylation domain-containing protein [Bdellovibrio bacteriovorus]|uniref:prepilin-type N-terminal cleavage/methylation domain-containing protein n=1 Tax=Bdellovibrio bacteriovorus TaxID=959 RepID=UPI0035A6C726
MKRSSRGFTMIELLLAMSLAALVIAGTVQVIYYFFSEKKNLDDWSAAQIDMSLAIKNVENDVRNIVRLEPTEDLLSANDGLYFGLSSLKPQEAPEECMADAAHSVFRYTTLDRVLRSERTLRAWSESGDADKTGEANELRVSADATMSSLFQSGKAPTEISLVDADRRFIRRYEVGAVTMNLNSARDPYDGLPKTDANGNPLRFNYASVFLKMPKNAQGAAVQKRPSVFVTSSEVYASSTVIVCLRKTDLNLIKIEPLTNKVSILLQNRPSEFNVSSFVAKYLGTRKGVRVDPANFMDDTVSDPNGYCVNSVFLELKASLPLRNQTGAATSSNVTKNNVTRARTVFAPNLNAKRAVACLQ